MIASFIKITQERMRLPICNKGCGLREAVGRQHVQYIGAIAQCIPQLIDQLDKEGNTIPGWLNIDSVIDYLSEGSFNSPVNNSWGHMLEV